MKQKFKIQYLGIKDKFLETLKQKLWNEEIKEHLIQKNRQLVLVVILTNNKVVFFESDNETYGKAFSYQYFQVKKIWKNNETKTKSDLFIDLDDNKLFSFEFQSTIAIDSFITFFNSKYKFQNLEPKITKNLILEKMEKSQHFSSKDFRNVQENQKVNQISQPQINPSKSISLKEVEKTKSNLPRLYVNKPQHFTPEKRISQDNFENTFKSIIDDKNIASNKTFSSKYINDLLTKRNTLLPNGALSLVEKLGDKLSALELSFTKPDFNLDISQTTEIGIEVSKLKKRVYDIEMRNYDEEIIGLKMFAKKEIESFANNFALKINEINSEIKKNHGSENVFNKINQLKNLVFEEIHKIRNIATDDRKFLEKTALTQKNLGSEVEKLKHKITNHQQQIFDVQKAWLDIKEKVSSQINKTVDHNFNNELLNEIETKINQLAENFNFKNIFKEATFEVNNKILAIDEKGHGVYFNIENFKEDIVNIIKKYEISIYDSIESKIDKIQLITDKVFDNTLQRFETIKKWYEEIKDFKVLTEKIEVKNSDINLNHVNENVLNQTKFFYFKALSYSYQNELRYGIRSGMKWSIEDSVDGRRGINSLYVDRQENQLNLADYDGIVFNNQKYYFNTPDEFSDNFYPNCKFQSIKYNLDGSFDKIFSFDISKDSFIYTVTKQNQEILDDRFPDAALYDLKWLTFFKD